MQLLEAQAEIIRAILNELKFSDKPRVLRELVDEIGLYVSVFTEPMLGKFYEASVKSYIAHAPQQEMPTFQDIIIELESSGNPAVDIWKRKYSEKQQAKHSYTLAAKVLLNSYLGTEVKGLVTEWLEQLNRAEDVKEEIAGLVSSLINISTDGHADARPSSILRKAREVGVRDPEPTGFDALNRVWGGGFRPKWLVAIGAPSGSGKTSGAVSFMCERVRQGRYTLYNSFEQPSEELLYKSLANLSGVLTLEQVENPDQKIRTEEEWQAYQDAEKMLDRYVRIYDQQCKLEEVAMRVRRHQAEFGQKMDFAIIDHIGIADPTKGNSAAEWSRGLEQTSYFFKNMVCKPYNVCTLMYSQVTPEVTKQLQETNDTSVDAMRGSAGIKNAVDILAIGCRHNGKVRGVDGKLSFDPSYSNVMVLKTTKNRREGVTSRIGLRFDAAHHRLLNQEVAV